MVGFQEQVTTYFCVVRTNATEQQPASILIEEKPFHAAHWASAMGRAIPKGKTPGDPMPIERGAALELLNKWNRFSDHGLDGREVKYWLR